MPAEARGVELERHARRERELPDRQRGALRARPVEPGGHLVRPRRTHGRIVEWSPVPLEHRAVPAAEADPDLRQPRPGAIVAAELEREQLTQPVAAVALDHDVRAGLELQVVQRGLEREAPAVHRRGERQDGPLQLLSDVAILGERRAHVRRAHATTRPGSCRVNQSPRSANTATAPIARFSP